MSQQSEYPTLSFRHKLRGYTRLVLFAVGTLYYVSKVAVLAIFLGDDRRRALSIRKDWANRMIQILGIKMHREGNIPTGNELLLANHRTYIDPVLVLSECLSSVVAKAEVGKWAIIGWGMKVSHVVLVQRENRQSRHNTRNSVKEWLDSGFSLIIYPEGTTHAGPGILPLKPGMFHMVARNNYRIVPVATSYRDPQDAWVGDDTFIRHFIQCFGKKHVEARVRYGEPIAGTNGEQLRKKTEHWLIENLKEMDAGWEKF